MRVTLRDIARRACVSTSTVSRVLNGYPYVSEATRAAVWQAAQDLGYPLNALRRPRRATRTVLLLTYYRVVPHDEPDMYPVSGHLERMISSGAQSVFESHGIATRIQRTDMQAKEARQYADDPAVTGLILMGGIVDRDFVQNLQALGVSFVVAGAHVQPLRVDCVMADVFRGMEQVVTHLIERGRKRIGLVNGPPTTTTSEEKYKGFRLTLCEHRLPFSPEQVVSADFKPEAGYEQTLRLLAQVQDLDAIVYAHDAMALGGLCAIRESGYRVPADIAITGFHNEEIARFTDPPLTSVHFDARMLGVIAARRLCMMIEEPDGENWHILLPTSLVVRGSTEGRSLSVE
ncbi:MAG TPA: LacI family transcriptional regulator [Caldilineae bacterium]|nr:LacI family transcriptional regulator [Caldilineae bacterium]